MLLAVESRAIIKVEYMFVEKKRNTELWKNRINNFLLIIGFGYFIINLVSQLIIIIC